VTLALHPCQKTEVFLACTWRSCQSFEKEQKRLDQYANVDEVKNTVQQKQNDINTQISRWTRPLQMLRLEVSPSQKAWKTAQTAFQAVSQIIAVFVKETESLKLKMSSYDSFEKVQALTGSFIDLVKTPNFKVEDIQVKVQAVQEASDTIALEIRSFVSKLNGVVVLRENADKKVEHAMTALSKAEALRPRIQGHVHSDGQPENIDV